MLLIAWSGQRGKSQYFSDTMVESESVFLSFPLTYDIINVQQLTTIKLQEPNQIWPLGLFADISDHPNLSI